MFAFVRPRPLVRVSMCMLLASVACGVLWTAEASAALPGSVYTQTNAAVNNQVIVFTRAANGSLTELGAVPTGGNGDANTPPFGFTILDSQGGVELSDSQHLLFAVNAGSDTLSSFRVKSGGDLELVGTVPTGDLPISVTSHGNVVYVLNEGDISVFGPPGVADVDDANPRAGTIQGYVAGPSGQLTPIPNSLEPLSVTGSAAAVPAQISFDASGRTLTVTHRFRAAAAPLDRIDTFVLGADATPGPVRANLAVGDPLSPSPPGPFGFAYTSNGRAIVSNAVDNNLTAGSISSYSLDTATGALTFVDNEPTTQGAPCWVVITPDNKFAYVTNTNQNPGTLTRLRIEDNGTLTELGQTPVPSTGGAPADAALTPDGKFLTVLTPTLTGAATSQTNTYAVNATTGDLTLLAPGGETADDLPSGVSGLAASAADSTAPDTAVTSGPADGSRTNDNTPSFAFAAVPANEPNPTFTCSVDNGAAVACTSPFTTAALPDGAHSVKVTATDFGANADATPATRTFTVDTVAPDTTIDAGPGNNTTTSDTTPTFGFNSSEANSSFRCRVDGGAFGPCTSPFTTQALASGTHSFAVAATDAANNTDGSPAVRTFKVEPVKRPQPGCSLRGTQRIGTNANNTLNGGPGVDIIFGLGGKDTLRGRGNRDCVYGGSGNDSVNGGAGNDRLFGNAGSDRLTDSSGRDIFSAGDSNDRIDARDATSAGRRVADTVRCGPGRRDVALVDRSDIVARDCERVTRRR